MAGISLYRSNSLEHLAETFCTTIVSEPLPALSPELILVQSIGMGRWLSLSASERLGVWANVRYLYPNAFLDLAFGSVLDEYGADAVLSKHLLSWRIMEELPRLVSDPVYAPLSGYLGDTSGIKLFQLSEKIADMYDQYIAARPDTILAWDQGRDELVGLSGASPLELDDRWQSDLWRRLRKALPFEHRAAVRQRFLEKIRAHAGISGISRISVFGASTLPAFHLGILRALSEVITIDFYQLSPTRHYWGDIAGTREQIRIARKRHRQAEPEDHFEKGNALLASMGQQGREFSDLLSFCYDSDKTADEDFLAHDDLSLLHQIQNDICELRDRDAEEKGLVPENDRSIQIHVCHSVMREVETLFDNLLAFFDNDDTLQPRDILVMTPDIDLYAPYIEAVFGAPERENLKIPYSIADRNVRAHSVLIGPFLSLLSLNEKRFAASAVADLLSSAPVRRKWSFSDDDMVLIRGWMENAGIRWGIDSEDRQIQSDVAFGQNSFIEGIRRLVSGYAMRDDGELCDGILPAEYAEGSTAELLGSFAEIVERLASFARFMRSPHAAGEWQRQLDSLLVSLFAKGEDGDDEFQQIGDALRLMSSSAEGAGFSGTVDYRVVRDYLVSRLDETKTQFGFLNGRVTFCAILPMRSIPFRVICMIGMNDGAFPRVSRPLSFDLMARSHMPGDRSQRNDDRYLFLESILSARECLYISHIGRSIKDNAVIPPSVLVSELLDYIHGGYHLEGAEGPEEKQHKAMAGHLVTQHRLHRFSSQYFTGEKLFSYSPSARSVAVAAGVSGEPSFPFLVPFEGDISDELLQLDTDELLSFFENPSAFFLKRRLGILYRDESRTVSDDEPFDLDYLYGIRLQSEIAERTLSGGVPEKVRTRALHGGSVPPGTYGEHLYGRLEADALSLAAKAGRYAGKTQIPARVCLSSAGVRVEGALRSVTEKGLICMRAQLWKRDYFRFWLSHLMLNAAKPDGVDCSSVFVTLDGGVKLPPVDDRSATAQLSQILALYGKGLSSPLKFFPKSSFAYADAFHEKDGDDPKRRNGALSKAEAEWSGSSFSGKTPERDNPYTNLCFGTEAPHAPGYPLDEEFAETALLFFGDFFSLKEDLDGTL